MSGISRRELLAGFTGAAVASALPVAAEEAAGNWLDQAARTLLSEFKVPAVWLAGGLHGSIETAVAGVRKYGETTPATLNDRLMIASISKPFTGTWIARMVEQGKVRYDARLLEVMPELRDDCLPEHADITLAQLLTHTAGVKRDAYPQADFSRQDLLPEYRQAIAKELVSTPGPNPPGKELYSNIGLTTAAALVERAARVNYNVDAADYFRNQLGLRSWGMGSPNPKSDLSAPWHHHFHEDGRITAHPTRDDQVLVAFPSGGIHCTIEDLARFGQLTLDRWWRRNGPLSKLNFPTLLAGRPDSGTTLVAWGRALYQECPVFFHGGGLGGLGSYLEIYPDLNLLYAYVVTTGWWNGDKLTEKAPDINGRVRELVRDELRKRSARKTRLPRCEIALTRILTVDSTRKQEVRPSREDDKIRVNVEFTIAGERTGDLKVAVQLGEEKREANFFKGLMPGNHLLYFDFDIPHSEVTPFELSLDALHTSGNRLPNAARHKSELKLDAR